MADLLILYIKIARLTYRNEEEAEIEGIGLLENLTERNKIIGQLIKLSSQMDC